MSSYGCTRQTSAIISTPHQRAHSVMAVPSELMQHRSYHRKEDQQQRHSKSNGSSTGTKSIVWYQEIYKKYGYEPKHNSKPTFFGPYLLLQTLGEGEFAKVKAGVHGQLNQEVAIKLMKKEHIQSAALEAKLKREITILKSVNHRHIVKLFEVLTIKNYIGIVMQRAAGGELFDYILKQHFLQEPEAKRLFAQLISGVDYMHKKQIVHRDLKLENLLLSKERNIIITDFGFANSFTTEMNDMMATSCGSPCYAAPELVISESSTYAGTGVDIWSCGVILFAMLCGYLPFDDDPTNPQGANINALYRYIVSTPVQVPKTISAEATHLLRRMLVPNPVKRCTIDEIKKHPWLQEHAHIFEESADADQPSVVIDKAKRLNTVPAKPTFSVKADEQPKEEEKETNVASYQGVDCTETASAQISDPAKERSSIEAKYLATTNKRNSSSQCQRNSTLLPTVEEVKSLGVTALENHNENLSKDEDGNGIAATRSITTTSSATLVVAPAVPPKHSNDSTAKTTIVNINKPLPLLAPMDQNASKSTATGTTTITTTSSSTSSMLPTKLLSALQKESTKMTDDKTVKNSYRKSFQQSILSSLQNNKIVIPNRPQSVYSTPVANNTLGQQHQYRASIGVPTRNVGERENVSAVHQRRTNDIEPSVSERTNFIRSDVTEQQMKSKGQRLVDWFKKLPSSHSTRINLGTSPSNGQKRNTIRIDRPFNAVPDSSVSKPFGMPVGSYLADFDDSRLKFHKGAIDQDALTAIAPYKVFDRVKDSLRNMGIDMKKCHDYKLKCTRPARYGNHQPHPLKDLNSTTMRTRKRLTSLFSHHQDKGQPIPKNQLLANNRYSHQQQHQQFSNTIYGDRVFDAGEEVQFSVEVSKIANLAGLYVVDIKRTRGNIWAFKFLYHKLLESLYLKNNDADTEKHRSVTSQAQHSSQQRKQYDGNNHGERKDQQQKEDYRRRSYVTSSSSGSSSMLGL